MWWEYQFMEQTEEWHEVPSTGKGKAMPQRGIVTEDDTRGHTVGWRYCTLSSSTSSFVLPLLRFYKDKTQVKSIQCDNTFHVAPDSSNLSAGKTLVDVLFWARERTARIQ